MGEKSSEKKQSSASSGIDLSALDGFSLGPQWSTTSKQTRPADPVHTREPADRDRHGGVGAALGTGRDRGRFREGQRPAGRRPERPGRSAGRRSAPQRPVPFHPTCEVQFFPEDAPFKALARAVKASFRTFELFELARLILDKPDRFVVFVRPAPEGREAARPFHVSQPDGLPFRSEEEARQHVFSRYMDRFFEIETVEVDPPKGHFQVVNRCGITGELLGPPNYHRYQALLQQHYTANLSHVSYERFVASVKSVREQEQIDAWLQKMTSQTRFKVREELSGAGTVFDDPESAHLHLLRHHKDLIVRESDSARFAGQHVELLSEQSDIRRSVEAAHEHQMRFPLEAANHLRGRLRRLNFAVYKKGSKGVSYVCAVKRRAREPSQVFADSVQSLITFIEQHPNIVASELPTQYLGLPERAVQGAGATSRSTEEAAEDSGSDADAANAGRVEQENAEREAEARPDEPQRTPEEQKQLNQLRMDLRWLLSEGYLTEYSDGRLFASPPATAVREPEVKGRKRVPDASESEPDPSAGDEGPAAEAPGAGPATSPVEESDPDGGRQQVPEASEASDQEEQPASDPEPSSPTSGDRDAPDAPGAVEPPHPGAAEERRTVE